jgi:hypothetical protein
MKRISFIQTLTSSLLALFLPKPKYAELKPIAPTVTRINNSKEFEDVFGEIETFEHSIKIPNELKLEVKRVKFIESSYDHKSGTACMHYHILNDLDSIIDQKGIEMKFPTIRRKR